MKNHFATFSLPTVFALDEDELEKKYLDFQKRFHPDQASTADIEQSMAINEAYEILKNPLRRASHILQLNGIDLENDEVAPKVNVATLTEVLELREKIFESSAEEAENFKKDLNSKIKSLIGEAALSLDSKDFKTAAQILIRAKYFEKTLKDLKGKKWH